MSYIPSTIEHYEKLFGIIAIEKGFISPDDLIKALMIQVKELAREVNQQKASEEALQESEGNLIP